jgi:predicted DNA-binding protein YlxM (UPF0122 family)
MTIIVKALNNILDSLTERERDIILKRYGLEGKNLSLSEIAKNYGISRERVRQIQEKAIKKIKPLIESENIFREILKEAKEHLGTLGSKKEKKFLSLVSNYFKFSENELKAFKFVSIFSPVLIFHQEDDIFANFYSKDENFYKITIHSLKKIYSYFVKTNQIFSDKDILEIVLKEIKYHLDFEPHPNDIFDLVEIIKHIEKNPFNFWGLKNHSFINPKSLKDKIYFILKKEQKPLHYSEIYKTLHNLEKFEDVSERWFKKYNINSLRNELIKHPEFVLVGRGKYGLKEWGLVEGTAKELIIKILKERKRIEKEKLWQIISSLKEIKPSSFYLYLKQMKNVREVNGYLEYNG